ncbi:MAG: 2-amino-4-hydroxy-6-hydroxymethyldihydropteridine diphosphokinase [Dehalococcoidia bacterium]
MTGEPPVVYLGLGSNLGDRERNLIVGLRRLAPLVRIDAVSSLYETDPVGPQDQPSFLNAACQGVTGLRPQALLRHLQEVERDLGRRRGERWGPRTLDLDLLLYGEAIIDEPGLRVPHPALPERAFVLVPLAEIASDVRHPQIDRTIGELKAAVDASGVRKRAEPGWETSWPAQADKP